MKVTFSRYWHIFYWTVITVLGYLYYDAAWSTAHYDSIFETRNRLRRSNELLDTQNGTLLRQIQNETRSSGDTSNQKYWEAAQKHIENNEIINNYLREVKTQIIEKTGGYDIRYTDGRMVNPKSYFPEFSFFDKQKKGEIKLRFENYEKNKRLTISILDKNARQNLERDSIIKDPTFWDKLASYSPANALLKLEELHNSIKQEVSAILNIFAKEVGPSCWKEDYWWKLGIHLDQHNVYVGDEIKGDVALFLPSRYLCGRRNFEFFVNGKLLPIDKDGMPYYKSIATNVGKKTLKAECRIKNPLTGETMIATKNYSIIVLPKPEN